MEGGQSDGPAAGTAEVANLFPVAAAQAVDLGKDAIAPCQLLLGSTFEFGETSLTTIVSDVLSRLHLAAKIAVRGTSYWLYMSDDMGS